MTPLHVQQFLMGLVIGVLLFVVRPRLDRIDSRLDELERWTRERMQREREE